MFAFFAWRALPRSKLAGLALIGVAFYAAGYVVAAFLPCDAGCRPAQPSFSQAIHNVVGLGGYVAGPLALIALGWQARSWPNATHLSILGFVGGSLALLGLLLLSPTFKYVGVAQRIIEGSMLVWIVACGLYIKGRSATNA